MPEFTDPNNSGPEVQEEATSGGDVLSFRPVGRPLELNELEAEFSLMRRHLKKEMTAEVAQRICAKSGTHLLKLVSPRADGDHAILNVQNISSNRRTRPLPSVNAADIPFAKVIFRPLEIRGHRTLSLVDEILNPDEVSDLVFSAFAAVFGEDVFHAIQSTLLGKPSEVQKLAAGEFPIIFVPRPGGGDLQITPVAPATAYMGVKVVISPFFEKQTHDGPKIPRGKFHKQAVSSKPQNISGAIGGPRTRLFGEMPPDLSQVDAELYRFTRGGSFPRWREGDIDIWILRYADMLEADREYHNKDTRAALDRTADRLIRDAEHFIEETLAEARHVAERHGVDPNMLQAAPGAGTVLLRRRWARDEDYQKARRALSSAHFGYMLQKRHDSRES